MKKQTWKAAVLAAAIAATAMAANADGEKRPMALMVMFDGLRADAIESGEMPNLAALRNGTWQPGYNAAWTVTGQNAPGTPPVSAPNHASIATGVSPSKHGVTANGKTASGNYAAYPTCSNASLTPRAAHPRSLSIRGARMPTLVPQPA